ncbi:MAG: hypothetical protein LC754_14290 [Acidobacteria bacterium]|nr:hypothetical protein [Acidobacteriota bacterium]
MKDAKSAGAAREILTGAGLLPREMPDNYTFNKVREILSTLESSGGEALRGAVTAASRLEVRGPLAATIFVKHHLAGAHEVEVDRLSESEEGVRYAVLVYTEGELPIKTNFLPEDVREGSRLSYDPSTGRYTMGETH